jgi:hypothetical protein
VELAARHLAITLGRARRVRGCIKLDQCVSLLAKLLNKQQRFEVIKIAVCIPMSRIRFSKKPSSKMAAHKRYPILWRGVLWRRQKRAKRGAAPFFVASANLQCVQKILLVARILAILVAT